MKAQRFPSEHSLHSDPATGAVVHQLTNHPSINHATYFLQPSLTPDGGEIIFTSYRSGNAQLYSILDFPEGPIRQWTEASPIHPFSPAIHPSGDRVYFVRGGAIWLIHRETLSEQLLFELPGAQFGEVSLSRSGDWITAAFKQGSQAGLVAGPLDGSAWTTIPFPRTVIHPQFHPLELEWIEFAGDPAPRMHRVRRDGTGLECLYDHGNDEFVVHETFLGDSGDLVYTVWPHALWRMDWQTRVRGKICDFNAWHITPNRAGSAVLCDTNHPDRGLFLIDVVTGHPRPLALSEAGNRGSQWTHSRYALSEDFAAARSAPQTEALSWMETASDTVYGPQWTHPHPSFSPDESLVVFTSDRTGHPQVYAVEIGPPVHG